MKNLDKDNTVPEKFKWMELKGNMFVETNPLYDLTGKVTIGGQVDMNTNNKTTFERAVQKIKDGKEPTEVQLIKSWMFHSEFHQNSKLMFCEYLIDIKIKLTDKSFEEECKIKPTEEEWKSALNYRNKRILKVIRFSNDFERYESEQIKIPLKISKEDRTKIYRIVSNNEYWQERRDGNRLGKFYNQLLKIYTKYEKEEEREKQIKLKEENKHIEEKEKREQEKFEKRLPEIKKKVEELKRRAGLIK